MFRYAFRLHRWGMVGYGVVVALSALAQGSAYRTLAGTTAASRAAFERDMTVLASQLSYILPVPHHLQTVTGYVWWRSWGTYPLVIAFWAVAAAAGAVRGDEDKQLVDSWLAAGVSRARLVVTRILGFGAAAAVVAAAAAVATVLGTASQETPNAARLAGETFVFWLLMLTLFSLVYLLAQVPGSLRGAQAAGAVLMLLIYVVDAWARSNHSLDGLAWITPFRWYEATDVLPPGGHVDVAGVLLSVLVTVAATGLAVLAFTRRDVRGALFSRRLRAETRRDARPSRALDLPVLRLLYRQRWVLGGWGLVIAFFAVFMVGIAHSVVDSLNNMPSMHAFLTRGSTGDPYRQYISMFWFGIAQLLLSGFAIHTVSGWAGDDTQGVLAAVLSTPRPRWSVVVERMVMAAVGVAVLAAVGSLAAYVTAAAIGTRLDVSSVVEATWLLIPFGLSFAAAGAVLATRWPRAAIGVLGALTFLSYLSSQLGPFLGWPSWATNLSIFALYGTPLTTGIFWGGLWAMVGIVVLGLAASVGLMQRREVAAG